jgi:hypothetical protein
MTTELELTIDSLMTTELEVTIDPLITTEWEQTKHHFTKVSTWWSIHTSIVSDLN